ncbi:BCCT family transporter [Auritidibacter sp. NML100628]|uniref:BCCT family transporter n=1 Tax=Auritidibacter sp. NML100628 TaxID=2170742 RepID=UPI000D73405E|nr:BCCT family transporter [Auritidibacter sp. NML100628]PXA76703.1 choline transporter [Auritidibacter sp. NML100628]
MSNHDPSDEPDEPPTAQSAGATTTETSGEGSVLTEETEAEEIDKTASLPQYMSLGEHDSDSRIVAKLRRQGVKIGRGMIAPHVFWPSTIIVIAVALCGIFLPDATGEVLNAIQTWIVDTLGWYYVLCIMVFIGFALFFGLSKYGRLKLGSPEDKPDHGLLSWFCMLFAAGMGIGLVFYGVGEPLTFATVEPKPGWEGSEADIAKQAMAQTFVHWGIHPWAVYAIIGLAVAYTIHRRGRPVSIRWVFEPLLGERVKGILGDVIDILAVFGTIFGVATSLGLGVQQIGTGLEKIGIVETADTVLLVILIVVITFIATLSVVSGVGRGMKWLSNFNLSLAGVVLIALLLMGPTLFIFQNLVESLGVYLATFFEMSLDVATYTGEDGSAWASSWTLFYWGWWVSWAPFVGIFIARISRGRTVRQFIAGVLLVPPLVGFLWFGVLGGTGIFRQLFGAGDLVEDGEVSPEGVLFDVLGDLPLGMLFSIVGILLVTIFFVTSSDSGSLVMDMLSSGGHPNPPIWSRVLFSTAAGALAIGLMLAGGLESLQAAALATALPFSVVLLFMCWSLVRCLRADYARVERSKLDDRYHEFASRMADDYEWDFPEQLTSHIDDWIDYRLEATRGIFNQKSRDPASPAPGTRPSRFNLPGIGLRRHEKSRDDKNRDDRE